MIPEEGIMAEQNRDGDPQGIPLQFCIPDDLMSRYATNFVVQHTDQEFILSFFETQNPLLLGSPEQNKATLQQMGGIRSQCVARIIVAPGRMSELIRILQANYEKYVRHTEEPEQ